MAENKPVLIELDEDTPQVADAPQVPDVIDTPQGEVMQSVVKLATRRPSRLARWFWGLLLSLLVTAVSLTAYNAVLGLIATTPMLGYAVTGLIALFVVVCVLIAGKELLAFASLGRVDRLHARAEAALADNDLAAAKSAAEDLARLYGRREETAWGRARMKERMADSFDASAVFAVVDQDLMSPLDKAAQQEVEAAARQVATVTALVPLALADVLTALVANLRMIRRIAEIYAGRSGTLGNWRLTRAVMTHLVATGAVAVGDDLIGSVAGGSILSKVSRRFGEGIVNGALTARVGVAAMEVCRPLPFDKGKGPRTGQIVKSALAGLFNK
ncbi:YcjF family protein [Cognatishimia activa]|uniref:TIGR01620 family protein n=1 Tax=Cognatishimia activa TaxID=1715691 RepID=A0A975ESU4_9RHOB|nr:TIGR01620 family protein [Cognatishimia activa]QTN36471.1 TIGR01620 family protein [Cognatishimia activa]